MPRHGFKSITISETVYDKFIETFTASKEELKLKGIFTATAYFDHLMRQKLVEMHVLSGVEPKIKKILIGKNSVILKDNRIDRVVEVNISKGLECKQCNSSSCSHVGFCYSLHEIYPVLYGGATNG